MTKGIRVIWPAPDYVYEINYFDEIDVDNLDSIPAFSSIRADWPDEGLTDFEYSIDVRLKRPRAGEVHVVIGYEEARNPQVAEMAKRRDFDLWGTNTIVLKQGDRTGHCCWRPSGAKRSYKVRWEANSLGESHDRPLSRYWRSRRYADFRKIILAADGHRCVITEEETPQALEAAHLVPAKNGENDISCNGITLRADLHRLFDAGLFTFDESGKVMISEPQSPSFDAYRQQLQNAQLRSPTLERVRETLTLPQFRDRLCS